MCNIRSEVDSLVEEKVLEGEHFTAYDITVTLRKENPGDNIPHDEVRRIVHSLFRDGKMGTDYITTAVKFPGAPREAILYHSNTFDIQSFLDSLGKKNQPNAVAVAAVTSADGKSDSKSDAKLVGITTDDRIYIPTDVCRTASFYPGDEGYAEVSNKSILIRKPYPGEEPNCTVDCKGNLRVRKDVIFQVTKARTGNASVVFEVSLQPNSIIKLTQK